MTADEQMKEIVGEGITFSSVFNQTMVTILDELTHSKGVKTLGVNEAVLFEKGFNKLYGDLSDKRAFGEKKYGDRSFQTSLENLLHCPIEKHLEEEIVDAINYVLALIYINGIVWNDDKQKAYKKIAENLLKVYWAVRQESEKK